MPGFDGSSTCWWPTLPVPVKRSQRLDVAKFGDGYQQRTLNGINTSMAEWSVNFVNRPEHVILEMDAWLEARKGAAFGFKEPASGKILPVYCSEWAISWEFRRYPENQPRETFGTLSATFTLDYGIGLSP